MSENCSRVNKRQIDYEKIVFVLLWIILILWRIPMLNKGIDYTDTGFSLANYYNVFYSNGINGVGLFLTNFIGGVIYKVLPAYQLLAYRVLHWIMYVAVDIITYRIFRKYLKPNVILVALLALNLGSSSGEALFSYYPLTKLFLIAGIALFLKGLTENRNILVAFSGILFGINVSVRLPNILFCIIIVAVILYGVWAGEEKKVYIRKALLFFFGALCGYAIMLLLMIITMGFQTVLSDFGNYLGSFLGTGNQSVENFLGISEYDDHSILAVFRTVAIQVFQSLKISLIFGIPLLAIYLLLKYVFKDKLKNKKLFFLVTIIVEALVIFIFRNHLTKYNACVRVFAMFLLSLFALLLNRKKGDAEHKLIHLIVLLVGICCVFGSDLGLNRVSMLQGFVLLSMILGIKDISDALPCIQLSDKTNKILSFAYLNIVFPAVILIIISTYVLNISTSIPKTYMDADISQLNCSVNSDIGVLKGMKTSETRMKEINEYYEVLSSDSLRDKEVAVFGYFPLGYVIGPQHDYFEEVQPCVDYPGVSVELLLTVIQKKQASQTYPVIVLSHVNALQRGDNHDTSEAKLAVMNYMLSLTDYQSILDDDYYTIYVPKTTTQQ